MQKKTTYKYLIDIKGILTTNIDKKDSRTHRKLTPTYPIAFTKHSNRQLIC